MGFIERYAMKIVVCVCTLPGGLEDCLPYSLGWVGSLPIIVDYADNAQTGPLGREVPPQVLTISVLGVSSAVWGSEAQGPWLCVWSDLFPALLCLA